MYVKACGQALLRDGKVKGKKWFSLTADYAFGHDLFRVADRFVKQNGGEFIANELVPTDTTDFSAFILKVRQAQPDLVVSISPAIRSPTSSSSITSTSCRSRSRASASTRRQPGVRVPTR